MFATIFPAFAATCIFEYTNTSYIHTALALVSCSIMKTLPSMIYSGTSLCVCVCVLVDAYNRLVEGLYVEACVILGWNLCHS